MEIWKDIVGYEGLYQVSNFGNVKSLYFGRQKILKQCLGTNGYLFVNLYKDKNTIPVMIHRVVFEAFYGIKSCRKYVIDHIDNNKQNNLITNLQYISIRLNSSKDKKSKTGYPNIYFNSGAYLVRMRVNNVKKTIGTFYTIEDAISNRDIFIKKLDKSIND